MKTVYTNQSLQFCGGEYAWWRNSGLSILQGRCNWSNLLVLCIWVEGGQVLSEKRTLSHQPASFQTGGCLLWSSFYYSSLLFPFLFFCYQKKLLQSRSEQYKLNVRVSRASALNLRPKGQMILNFWIVIFIYLSLSWLTIYIILVNTFKLLCGQKINTGSCFPWFLARMCSLFRWCRWAWELQKIIVVKINLNSLRESEVFIFLL